jgi:hypothetical protein
VCSTPFRLPGGAGGVKDEQRVLRLHLLARAIGRHGLGDVVVIDVAALLHVDGRVGALDHDDGGDTAGLLAGLVDIRP